MKGGQEAGSSGWIVLLTDFLSKKKSWFEIAAEVKDHLCQNSTPGLGFKQQVLRSWVKLDPLPVTGRLQSRQKNASGGTGQLDKKWLMFHS